MFAKLLKHEFRATGGMLGILCAACLSCALLGGGAIRYLSLTEDTGSQGNNGPFIILSAVLCVTAIIVIAACSIVMLLLLVNRFYRSRFTDEGYLTFTLPVSGHQILLTTLITSIVEMIAIFLAVVLSIVAMVLIGASGFDGFKEEFRCFVEKLVQALLDNVRPRHIGYLFLGILYALCSMAAETCVIMLSVSLGALVAKKHKILLSLLFYYLIHITVSILGVTGLTSQTFEAFMDSMNLSAQMLLAVAAALVLGAVCYFPTHYLITRRLNLP